MKATKTLTFVSLASFMLIMACNDYVKYEATPFYSEDQYEIISQTLNLPDALDSYDVFASPFGPSNDNMIATVGRVLFYDKELSADGTISCASCHQQQLGFSDNVNFSKGVHGNLTTRNSIALGSLGSFDEEYGGQSESVPGLFWDERAPSVKAQMEQTFANPDEMGMDLSKLESIVESKPHYQTLFEIANFDGQPINDKINTDNILTAIETFVRSLSTKNSKFDKVAINDGELFRQDGFAVNWNGFSESENRGKLLFSQNCSSCHERQLLPFGFSSQSNDIDFFNPKTVANNGLDMKYVDQGVGTFSTRESDNGKFKIPGLKNIALTGPYMHDGRFETLTDVIDHYNEGLQDHPNLDTALRTTDGKPKKLNFNEQDKSDLLSFLNTLTDTDMAKESKWSDPFKK